MKHIPSRDITGFCEGECKDLVRQGQDKRQGELSCYEYSATSTPTVPWAKFRSEHPGFYGGHV